MHCFPVAAPGAAERVRLTVDVKVEGTESVIGNGVDRTSGKFREGYTLVTYLKSDGDSRSSTPRTREYAQKMLGLAAGRTCSGSAPRKAKRRSKKMTPQELQAYVQKKQAACGADQACLMKLAMEAQELMANMDTGGATARQRGAYTGDEPPRYLDYFGFDNCGATGARYVDRTTQGTLGDYGGAVPYTVRDTADYTATPSEIRPHLRLAQRWCSTTQDGSFYSDGAVVPPATGTP